MAAHGEQAPSGIGRPKRLGRALESRGAAERERHSDLLRDARQAAVCAGDRSRLVLAVTADELVCTLAGKRDRDVARCELRKREEAERREIRERLVEEPDEILEVD